MPGTKKAVQALSLRPLQDDGKGRLRNVCRFQSDQLTEEIGRMNALLADMSNIPGSKQVDRFRLSHSKTFDRAASAFRIQSSGISHASFKTQTMTMRGLCGQTGRARKADFKAPLFGCSTSAILRLRRLAAKQFAVQLASKGGKGFKPEKDPMHCPQPQEWFSHESRWSNDHFRQGWKRGGH
jgi:hypothetical protein